MRIIIVPYKAEWPVIFENERLRLAAVLTEPGTRIEHVGSTSVPGLAAKPIVDIAVGLPHPSLLDATPQRLIPLGYEYIQKFEEEMPFRRFFRERGGEGGDFNLHVVEIGHPFWEDHLVFRDHLRENPRAAARYEQIKLRLAEREWADVDEYARAKSEFVQTLLMEAKEEMNITTETQRTRRRE